MTVRPGFAYVRAGRFAHRACPGLPQSAAGTVAGQSGVGWIHPLGEDSGQEYRYSASLVGGCAGRLAPPGGRGVNPDDAFERIAGLLYEAALDDALWPAAATLFEEAIGASGSILAVSEGSGDDARLHFARYLYRGESHPEPVREYFDVYHAQDEGIQRVRQLPRGRLTHGPELYTEEERKTSAAFNEGLPLLGCRNGLAARFDGPDGLRIILGTGDPVGGDGWESARLRLHEQLLPHVHRSVVIRQALAGADALGAGLAGLLDKDRIGVVQLDRAGRVLEANGPALDILRRGDGLVEGDGTLDAVLPADRSRLRRLLAHALPGFLGEAPSGGSMTVQRPAGRSRLGLHVMPVGDAAADFGGRRVAVLVLVVDPARRPRIDAQRVAVTLGLTTSEGRMAALLAEGLNLREIAAAQGWSEDYVRWLTKQVYRKLGVSGQVALVRHVLAVDALPGR